jgi:predicted deacylase
MKGSLASRVAATLTKKILPLVDFGLDFHTGGGSRYNYPQIRYTGLDPKALELAKQFAAPYLIKKPMLPKSLRKVAATLKKPVLVFEGGESLRFDGFSIDTGTAGIQRVLHAQGMLDSKPEVVQAPIYFEKTSWIRADRSGMFRWFQQSGAKIKKGEPLGVIDDPHAESTIKVFAKQDGYIIGHNNAPVVSQGDALFHIGFEQVN